MEMVCRLSHPVGIKNTTIGRWGMTMKTKIICFAADRETSLERAWGCFMMQSFAFSARKAQQSVTGVMLTEDEVKMITNQEYVDWETFHTEIIVKIFENRGTNKHNTAKRIVRRLPPSSTSFVLL
mmetsp:Transcript_15998/g.32169  ORF Transcript_15998/g.32169 Transcript_15998/m.32169 type:complete len:125 (+) Transcript_15998:354-728(+)